MPATAPRPDRRTRVLQATLVALPLLAVVAAVLLTQRGGGDPLPSPPLEVLRPRVELQTAQGDASAEGDPFAYTARRRQELERRAASGLSHVIYAKSPGGVVASAARTARYRPLIERVARGADLNPDLIEAIALLESAGRPDATADPELEGAVGLTQILAGTGAGLLQMRVDTAASRRLTARIRRAEMRGRIGRARRLREARRTVDERFDPVKALEGTARYLTFSRRELGRDDLAVVSYHMGVGNLTSVIEDFGAGPEPSYAQLFFQTTPKSRPRAFRRLQGLGDDSVTYYYRVLAAREIMRLYRDDRATLERNAVLHSAKNSAEEVLHPGDKTDVFDDPEELKDAYGAGELRLFPDAPGPTGLRRARQMGELARKLKQPRTLYRGLRPGAYALALYLARLTRDAGGGRAPLTVTSTVRDRSYQDLLARRNPEATRSYSLHTTGWTFDVLRRYSGGRQSRAFQFALDRLEALDLIAWVREPAAIHITVSSDAKRLQRLVVEQGG